MGNSQSTQKINYEDVQYVIKNAEAHILINTLNENEQECLLPNTIGIHKEADLINNLINQDIKDEITKIASSTTESKTLVKIQAILKARVNLTHSSATLLTMEALMLELKD